MIEFITTLKRFENHAEKTSWNYIDIPADVAQKLLPGNKKTFRVKGTLDDFKIAQVALMPMGGGNFIMAVNATMRKGIKKEKGAKVKVLLQVDTKPIKPPADFIECLKDEPDAFDFFISITKGHQNYFTNWIGSAKTEKTKAKRIADSVNALAKKMDYGSMIRGLKKDREDLYKF